MLLILCAMMSKSFLGRPSVREVLVPMPSVSFLGGDVDLLDAAEDQELIMGNLVMSGSAIGTTNQVNDSDSALLMSEMENMDEDDVRRPHSCQGDDHCHGPLPAEDIKSRNQLIAVSCCCFFFMVAEIVGEFFEPESWFIFKLVLFLLGFHSVFVFGSIFCFVCSSGQEDSNPQ